MEIGYARDYLTFAFDGVAGQLGEELVQPDDELVGLRREVVNPFIPHPLE